jgi:hypothetical protein
MFERVNIDRAKAKNTFLIEKTVRWRTVAVLDQYTSLTLRP